MIRVILKAQNYGKHCLRASRNSIISQSVYVMTVGRFNATNVGTKGDCLFDRSKIHTRDNQPKSFLHETEGLSKAMIGEYLGEGYATCFMFSCLQIDVIPPRPKETRKTLAIMHAFVDAMDFSGRSFIKALLFFLQSFHLLARRRRLIAICSSPPHDLWLDML